MDHDVAGVPLVDHIRVHTLVEGAHQGRVCRDGAPYERHLTGVAKKSEQLFLAHVRCNAGFLSPDDRFKQSVLYCAGLSHELLAAGMTYDRLSSSVCPEVADLVAHVTPDARLPLQSQMIEYESRLFAAPYLAQLLKLADLWDSVADAAAAVAAAGEDPLAKERVRLEIADWLPLQDNLLRRLRKVKEDIARTDVPRYAVKIALASTAKGISALLDWCETVSTTTKLRANIARRKAGQPNERRP